MIKTDRKPFVEWYDECAERVFKFLCAKVSSTADAQDLTSQTFLKAWQAYPNLRHPERFIPWVFTIARNLANDQYRRKKPLALPLDESGCAGSFGLAHLPRLSSALHYPYTIRTIFLNYCYGWSFLQSSAPPVVLCDCFFFSRRLKT